MSQSLLKAEHIKISFGNVHALRDVSLEILPGEIHCLAGENGCGKSTIIKIISGVYQRDGGTIEFNGQKIDKISPIDAINLGIQVIYQDFALFPNLTVAENLALNTELASRKKTVSWKNVRKIAEEAVSKINFQVDLDEKVEKLTVAQKQMVAISRALMSNAKLIIMDEPTTALTREEVEAMIQEDQLLEHAEYVGNYYGTPRFYVEDMLSQGKNVILEIEIQGAMKIKEKIPEAVLVFVTPPTIEELRSRLTGRGTETADVIASRLRRAAEESEGMDNYDYILINDQVEDCVDQLHQIILSERCRAQRNEELINTIQEEARIFMKGDK